MQQKTVSLSAGVFLLVSICFLFVLGSPEIQAQQGTCRDAGFSLTLNPTTADPGDQIIAFVVGLEDCQGEVVRFSKGTGSTASLSQCTVSSSGNGCTTFITAFSSTDTVVATLSTIGARDSQTLTITGGSPPPAPPPPSPPPSAPPPSPPGGSCSSGNFSIGLSPTSASQGDTITVFATGLQNCQREVVSFTKGSVGGPVLAQCNVSSSGNGCSALFDAFAATDSVFASVSTLGASDSTTLTITGAAPPPQPPPGGSGQFEVNNLSPNSAPVGSVTTFTVDVRVFGPEVVSACRLTVNGTDDGIMAFDASGSGGGCSSASPCVAQRDYIFQAGDPNPSTVSAECTDTANNTRSDTVSVSLTGAGSCTPGQPCTVGGESGMCNPQGTCVTPSTVPTPTPTLVGPTFVGPSLPTSLNITFGNPINATSFTDLINRIIDFIFTIAVILAPVLLVIAGVIFMTAAGDPGRVATARRMLLWTIIGFGIIIISKGLVEVFRGILGV